MTKYLQKYLLGAAFGAVIAAGYVGIADAQGPSTARVQTSAKTSASPQPAAQPRSTTPRGAAKPKASTAASYDGLWSVLIMTDSGPCDASFRYPIRITRGILQHAEQSTEALFNINGQVARDGGVQVVVSRGEYRADGNGQLGAQTGGGSWQTAGGLCSGRWTAARRG